MKSVKLLLILVVQASFLEVALAQAIHYDIYVDGNLSADAIGTYSVGERDNSGDQIAFKTIQEAVDYSIPGDTIAIRAGTYFPSTYIDIRKKEGTDPNNPITIRAYAETTSDSIENVIVDGTYTAEESYGLITIYASDYIQIKYIHVDNYYHGVYINSGSENCHLDELVLSGHSRDGIRINDSDYAMIENCIAYDNEGQGIYLRGSSYCTVDRNECYGNRIGILVGWHDTITLMSTYNIISNNISYDNITDPEDADGINITHGSRYSTVVDNICYGNADDGIDCSTGQAAGTKGDFVNGYYEGTNLYATVIGNICFDNGDGVGEGDGNGIKFGVNSGGGHVVGYNICFDNEYNGILCAGEDGYPKNEVYNNTTYHNGYYYAVNQTNGIAVDSSKTDPSERAVIYNNLSANNSEYDIRYFNSGTGVYDSDDNFCADGKFPSGFDGSSLEGSPCFKDADKLVEADFVSGMTIDDKLFYIRYQVELKFTLDTSSRAKDSGKIIEGFHNTKPGEDGGENIVWFGNLPDMGASIIFADIDISDLNDDTPDEDISEIDTTDESSVPSDNASDPVEDTGTSNPDNIGSPIKIQPLPLTGNLVSVDTDSSDSSQEDYSTISPLFGTSNEGLHVEKSTTNGVRKIKERRSFNKYDHLYGLAKKGWTKESAE